MIVDYLKNKYAFSKLKKGKWKNAINLCTLSIWTRSFKRTTKRYQKIIIENKELYDIGLHGPDLLFYYLPLKTNEINSIGYNMHEKTGKEIFDTFRKMMTSKKQINHS